VAIGVLFPAKHARARAGVEGDPAGGKRTARLSAAARSVRSQVKRVYEERPFRTVSGARPKCPYADVAE
jgi:hypothetical protein